MEKLTAEIFIEHKEYIKWTIFTATAILTMLNPVKTNENIYQHRSFIKNLKRVNDAGYNNKFRMWDNKGEEYTPQRKIEEEKRALEHLKIIRKFDTEKCSEDASPHEIAKKLLGIKFGGDHNDDVTFSNSILSAEYLINESKKEKLYSEGFLEWARKEGYQFPDELEVLNQNKGIKKTNTKFSVDPDLELDEFLSSIDTEIMIFYDKFKTVMKNHGKMLNTSYKVAIKTYHSIDYQWQYLTIKCLKGDFYGDEKYTNKIQAGIARNIIKGTNKKIHLAVKCCDVKDLEKLYARIKRIRQ